MGMMINRRRVYGGKNLPYDAEIEYLECDSSLGRAYIEIPNEAIQINSVIYAGFNILQIGIGGGSTYGGMFTLYQDEQHNWTRIVAGGNYVSFGVSFLSGWTTIDMQVRNVYYDAILKANQVTLNGTTYNISAPNNNRPIVEYPMRVGPSNDYTKGRNYYFKIVTNGVVTYDLIPVRVGQVGYMYDKVSKQLFGNVGTGAFILGPDK